MKNLFTCIGLVLLLSITSLKLNAQTKYFIRSLLANNNVYKTKDTMLLSRIYNSSNGKVVKDPRVFRLIVKPLDFVKYQIMEDGETPYICILPYYSFKYYPTGDTIVDIVFNGKGVYADTTYDYYFKVDSDIAPYHKYLAAQSIMGMPVALPIKLRKYDSEIKIESNISLSYAFGYRIKIGNNPYRKYFINFIPFAFGLNADKYFARKEDAKTDELSLTYYSFGLSYELRGLNFGVFGGWDKMFGQRKDWVYQDKFWLSFGIGYKFKSDN